MIHVEIETIVSNMGSPAAIALYRPLSESSDKTH
jgi:hypothetical protein